VVVDYDPKADCPTIRQFLADVLSPADRETVEMFLGYLLVPDHRFKKSLVLVGPKNTGKTTLLSLFFGLLGGDNMSGESLQDLCDNRFSSSALVESMHGAGSPQAQRIMIWRKANLEHKKRLAQKLAKIGEQPYLVC
jgi:phage/plasmid-associated DNA primase